jgi:hypothetical protein
VQAALRSGNSGNHASPAVTLSPALEAMLEALRQRRGYDLPATALYLVLVGWAQAQGLVTQEVFQQSQPLLPDPGELFRCEARAWLERLGLSAPMANTLSEEEKSHA